MDRIIYFKKLPNKLLFFYHLHISNIALQLGCAPKTKVEAVHVPAITAISLTFNGLV